MGAVCLMIVNAKNIRCIALFLTLPLSGCACERELREITETEISPSGGIARSFDGVVEVEFPSGAVDRAATVTIETLRGLQRPGLASAPYDLQLTGANLTSPVELRISTSATGRPRLAILEAGELRVVEGTFDEALGIVRGRVSQFTTYCALDGEPEPDGGIELPDAAEDSGTPPIQDDAEPIADAEPDAGPIEDAEVPMDAAPAPDTGPAPDAGTSCPSDAGSPISGADLAIGCFVPLVGPWQAGSMQSLSFDVANIGDAPAGNHDILVVLSENMIITVNDLHLATLPSAALAPLTSTTVGTTITIPLGLSGLVYIGVIVDLDNVVAESAEGNNARILGQVLITP